MPTDADRLGQRLSAADDRLRLSQWLPPHASVMPRSRVRQRWISVLWARPIVFVLLVVGAIASQALRQPPGYRDFLLRYPGVSRSAAAVATGFPSWLRLLHFLKLFLMVFIIRAGVQILADHSRLYWMRDRTPGTEWIAAIEFVHSYADLGAGEGGYNEDHEFYGYRVPV